MTMTIREFTPDDYPGIAAVWTICYPDHPETAEEYRHEDENRELKYRWGRFVAEENGAIVGVGDYGQGGGMYHPRKFSIGVVALPEQRGRGIGTGLYERITERLTEYDPITLRTFAREDHANALRFAAKRGFTETMRDQESRLSMADFDPSAFAADVARMDGAGVVIKTYPQMKAEWGNADALHREMHELGWVISQDIPHPDTQTRVPFEEWLKRFDRPGFLPDAQFYALDGDKLVGASMLWGNLATPDLNTGMTGVLREYRGKGIATALKVKALTWAKERGTPYVRTWNEANNAGMLGINYRLGFVKRPAWLNLAKVIKEDNHE